jgi:tetratricopeptide (TPR) repeat protein
MAIFLWIAIFFTAGLKKLLVRQDLRVRALGLGAFTGCFSLLVHDLVDFQLSIPSNAILFCLCTAVAMLCATTPRAETSPGGLEWPLSGRQQKLAVFLIPTLGAATLILLGSPFLGSLYFQKATSHRHSENADAALSAVQKAIGWESDNADYYAMAGDLEWERAAAALDEAERERILQRALSLYRRATAACPVSSYAQGRQAQALLHLGQVDRARESFERATALAPARFEPHYHLAWFYLRHGAPEDSLRELRLAISLNPDYLVPSLSQLRRMGFKYPELRAVVPETAPSIATFSEFLMAQGEIEAGLLEQVRAVSIEPTLARALAHLETSRRHEPLPDTLKLYRSYVRQFPRSGTLRNTGAEILEDAGRPEEAIQELEILPLELVEELVALYMKIGRVEKAVSLVREEVAQRPDQVEAYLRLATLLRTEERCDEALQALREGEGRFPDEPRIPFEKVACLRELERPEEILAALKQSVRLEPTHVQYRYELGKAYESIGVYLEAEAQWKKALEMAPGHDPSRRALESLYGELGLLSEPLP